MAGELAALAAAAFWAVASILWTRLGRESGAIALNFLKCAIAALLLAATMWVLSGQGWPADLPLPALLWLGLSGVAGLTIGDSAYFHALQRIGPRRTLLIWATSPAVSALLAWPILGEPIHRIMVLGMGLTLGGVTWVVLERSPAERNEPSLNRLRSTEEWVGIAYASVAVFGQAISNVLVKYGAQAGGDEVGALEASVIRLAIGALGVGIYLGALGRITETLVPFRSLPSTRTVFLATFLGTYLGIWLSAYGVIHAEIGVAATLNATSPLFVLPLAVWMEGEKLSLRAIAGAVIAVLGVGLFFWA